MERAAIKLAVVLPARKERSIRHAALHPALAKRAEKESLGARKPKRKNKIRNNIMTDEMLKQIIVEELKLAILEEEKKKTDKDRMKCNSPRRIRKGEAGHGKKKFVVKACDGGTEKIIRYGDANMEIKKDSPARRKSFRARHNCKNPGSKLKARYWSCKKW
jgi:hypothetical protein